jgi:vesicle transport through interaction with t-SNAREs 1
MDLEAQDAQRARLLSGTERLERSSQRLQESHRLANETEGVGAGILGDLHAQRQQLLHTRETLMEADGYVDKSIRTLKGMARRFVMR